MDCHDFAVLFHFFVRALRQFLSSNECDPGKTSKNLISLCGVLFESTVQGNFAQINFARVDPCFVGKFLSKIQTMVYKVNIFPVEKNSPNKIIITVL